MQDANYGLTLAMIKNIKATLFLFIGFLAMAISCNTGADEMKADNALDGGRYFIENCMKGDFSKAKNYFLASPQNQAIFDSISAHYFLLDKEGRSRV